MKILKRDLIAYAEIVNSPSRKEKRSLLWDMYSALNGGLYEIVRKAIRAEFKNPQAVMELEARLVPINILKKVIGKMGAVYLEAPLRSPMENNTDDSELLEDYEDLTKFNIRQKQANRYMECFKKNLKEIYVNNLTQVPSIKNLPPYSYEVFNVINPDKSQPDIICKIILDHSDKKEQIFHWFSDESFWVTDGEGVPREDVMAKLSNPQGKNPSKVLPFVYKCKSTDSVDPIIDDSLFRISVAIPIVLTDLFFACKYQCWSMIYTIGVSGEINRNPSSIISLQRAEGDEKDPVIDQIQPNVDSDKVISMIESTMQLFLSSVGLSGSTMSLGTQAKDVSSGVSKMLDSAEVIEGKKDQQDEMLDDEEMTWNKIIKLIPYWRRNQMLIDGINREFSKQFRVSTSFKDPKPLVSEKDALELSDMRIKQRKSTWTRELEMLYPDFDGDQIEQLKDEIIQELAEYPEIYNRVNVSINGNEGALIKGAKDGKGLQSKVSDKSQPDI
jgi:hypothetical protein